MGYIVTHNHFPPGNKYQRPDGQILCVDIEKLQYVSALLLCAPYTPKVWIYFTGRVVSTPYIDLTISVMKDFRREDYSDREYEYHFAAAKFTGA